MLESAVASKGQTALPKSVRQALDVKAGNRVRYVIFDNEVRLLAVRDVVVYSGHSSTIAHP